MTENRLDDYLDHMRQAASDALIFVEGLNRDEFFDDKRTQQAVVMSLIIIGEAATKIMAVMLSSQRRIPTCRGAACAVCATVSLTATSISILKWYGTRSR